MGRKESNVRKGRVKCDCCGDLNAPGDFETFIWKARYLEDIRDATVGYHRRGSQEVVNICEICNGPFQSLWSKVAELEMIGKHT